MVRVEGCLDRRRIKMAALLGIILFQSGCVCCGPRYFGEPGKEVGYTPMGQQRPSAEYSRELERRLRNSGR